MYSESIHVEAKGFYKVAFDQGLPGDTSTGTIWQEKLSVLNISFLWILNVQTLSNITSSSLT